MTDPDEPVTWAQRNAAKILIDQAERRGDPVPEHLRVIAQAPLKYTGAVSER